jgi:carboxyl-terminal processing protease
LLLAGGLLWAGEADDAKAAEVRELAQVILAAVPSQPVEAIWDEAEQIERLGSAPLPLLRDRLSHEEVSVQEQLLCGYLAARLGEPEGIARLGRFVRKGPDPVVRQTAARCLGMLGAQDQAAVGMLLEILHEESLSPEVRLASARPLWVIFRNPEAMQFLRGLAEGESDPLLRDEAALVLARGGQWAFGVRERLAELASEPTETGEEAAALLYQEHLETLVKKSLEEPWAKGGRLISEVAGLIQRYYVDLEKVEDDALLSAAARGMAASLDPHSEYYDEEETEEREEQFQGEYAGIGAVVQKDEVGYITIQTPFFNGPAYKAGIQAGDKITKVEGIPTPELTLKEAVKQLRGPVGTDVTIEIYRQGWPKPQELALVRGAIPLDTVYFQMLPAGIGYLRLTQFGHKSDEEFERALEGLSAEGMKGLILDLRFNGGGLLDTAVLIADKFLQPDQLIVYSEGRNPEVAPRREFRSGGVFAVAGFGDRRSRRWLNPDEVKRYLRAPPERKAFPPFPVVVLVNKASASASEILAGALQDHGRATVVGETTFGKGSVQQEMGLQSTDRRTKLKLTVAKYYLPSGRSIHGSGVVPDQAVPMEEMDGGVFASLRALVEKKVFDAYLDERYGQEKELFQELAVEPRGADPAAYPGFDDWYEGLETEVSREQVCRQLRSRLRQRVGNERGRPFVIDPPLDEDRQLQAAVVALSGSIGVDPETIETYRGFKEKLAAAAPATAESKK